MMLVAIIGVISVVVLILIALPFVLAKETRLVACAAVDSPQQLRTLKKEILARYLTAEDEWERKVISQRSWHKRQVFLTNRYIDACRRLDFLRGARSEKAAKSLRSGATKRAERAKAAEWSEKGNDVVS